MVQCATIVGTQEIDSVTVGVIGASLCTVGKVLSRHGPVCVTEVAVSALESEVHSAGHYQTAMVVIACGFISRQWIVVGLAVLLAPCTGSGASHGMSAHKDRCIKRRLVVVVAVKAFLRPRLVVNTVTGWHGGAGGKTGVKGMTLINLEVGGSVTLIA